MHIFVVGNCQVETIKTALRMLLPDCTFESQMLHLERNRDHESVAKRLAPFDLIITHPANPGFQGFSTESIRALKGDDAVITFNNIHFEGLHPDATYLGAPQQRIYGTLGEYHSKLVLAGYLAGLSKGACRELFEGRHFEDFGFLDVYASSLEELRKRSTEVDVPFFNEFQKLMAEFPCMLTFNHPTSNVLIGYARKLAAEVAHRTGVARADFPLNPYNAPSMLAENIVWPIYPALAKHHTSRKHGSFWFRRSLQMAKSPMLSVDALIAGDYDIYAHQSREDIESTPQYASLSKMVDIIV